MDRKTKRRLDLLDMGIDYALRSTCRFAMCPGPLAPIRDCLTCTRCAMIHRAIQMGLVKPLKKRYIKNIKGVGECVVDEGVLEQFSAIDGERVD